ncbi:putative allantoinase 1 [Trichoderma ghanense]|uniref:Allantoinase 1 n=1 Tax=Trichoderma ghanense TaxID=65468 RepID=A0ABY2HCJ7_9HYPO
MPLERLPPIAALHSYTDLAQTEVLDLLFEPSPAIHATLLPVIRTAVYRSYPDLVDACQIKLLSLAAKSAETEPNPVLLSVLGSHPRLGDKNVKSPQSAAEQADFQGDSEPEAEELAALNKEYEEAFPGLRYVVYVNGRGRPEIMEDMRARIERSDFSREVIAAVQAMCDIAKDRASKLPEDTYTRKPSNGN